MYAPNVTVQSKKNCAADGSAGLFQNTNKPTANRPVLRHSHKMVGARDVTGGAPTRHQTAPDSPDCGSRYWTCTSLSPFQRMIVWSVFGNGPEKSACAGSLPRPVSVRGNW